MIHDHVHTDYDSPPDELAFERRYSDVLGELQRAAQTCLDASPSEPCFRAAAMRIYFMAQAVPSVVLNYKICVEFGLPLHPTAYIDFAHAEKQPEAYRLSTREAAQELFLEAIDVARSVYRLDPMCPIRLSGLKRRLPEFLNDFVYTNSPDRYTWRASDPARVQALANEVRQSGFVPDLIVGAAHGSIRPAILLANLLGAQLYFLRFSMFKRADEAPVVSPGDDAYLRRFAASRVLLFDEDVAKGRTLRGFADTLRDRFGEVRTGAVLRYYLAPFTPDFVGDTFYD